MSTTNPGRDDTATRWDDAWQAGRVGWKYEEKEQQHAKNWLHINQVIQRYGFPQASAFSKESPYQVLVPMCGDGPIVKHLVDEGPHISVTGAEWAGSAVKALQSQFQGVDFKQEDGDNGDIIKHVSQDDEKKLTIFQGDFFQLPDEEGYDLIYDRAGFTVIEFERDVRDCYARKLYQQLKPGGLFFVEGFDKNKAKEGPPYHTRIDTNEPNNPFYQAGFQLIEAWTDTKVRPGKRYRYLFRKALDDQSDDDEQTRVLRWKYNHWPDVKDDDDDDDDSANNNHHTDGAEFQHLSELAVERPQDRQDEKIKADENEWNNVRLADSSSETLRRPYNGPVSTLQRQWCRSPEGRLAFVILVDEIINNNNNDNNNNNSNNNNNNNVAIELAKSEAHFLVRSGQIQLLPNFAQTYITSVLAS